ncbi:THAP domain-containing protein 6-like, partial [Macrosteles quadrilineatus]|uniref:THAP domain-containing protein 6-like n=1 Tax=Macrosteles quadrilineatus TaxID=74068 RepID=UPI0023E1AD81
MVNCAAFGCTNRTANNKKGYRPPAGITFHQFPKDEHLREKWTIAVSRKDWEPSKWSQLCSAHFRESDLDRTSSSCVRLRPGAVPCVFPAQGKELPNERKPLKRTVDEVFSTGETYVGVLESPRKKKLKKELDKTKSLLQTSKRKVRNLNQKKRRITKKIGNLKSIITVLKDKLNIADENCLLLSSLSKTSACLLKRSHEKNINPKMRKVYEDRLKAFAITLHFLSPKAYRFVRKTFDTALPHPRTLCRWYSTVDGEPGFSQEISRALKEYTNRNGETLCAFMLDSMSI